MDLKFVTLIKSFFPQGNIWEFQSNFLSLINGISVEFGRVYDKATTFYNEFNLINSYSLAIDYSKDYLVKQGLFTNVELQRIIVQYLNKDYVLQSIIEDFATFIGCDLEFSGVPNPFVVGRSTIGNYLGDPLINNTRCILYIKFNDIYDVDNIRKMKELISYIKPPYLRVIYNTTSDITDTPFIVGRNTTGNPLGQILT